MTTVLLLNFTAFYSNIIIFLYSSLSWHAFAKKFWRGIFWRSACNTCCYKYIFKCRRTCFIQGWLLLLRIFFSILAFVFLYSLLTGIAMLVFVGKQRFFACTGVIIDTRTLSDTARILTSGSLVRGGNIIASKLKVCAANHSEFMICLICWFS